MKHVLVIFLIGILIIIFAVSCTEANSSDSKTDVTVPESPEKRGEYLVKIMVCNDCHSPKIMGPHGPEPDPNRLLSGHPSEEQIPPVNATAMKSWVLFNMSTTAMAGPWGISYAANITSDSTGIGGWSEKQFFKAIREGKAKGIDGNRMILPPMPWPMYANATDEDLRAIFAYLKSTKPVKNVVPLPVAPDQISKSN